MSQPLLAAVGQTARFAWEANYTIADPRWRLTQLHGLYQLVLSERNAIISALAQGDAKLSSAYEYEIGLLVRDIHLHIANIENAVAFEHVESSQLGSLRAIQRPCGVNMLISGYTNPIRFALGPLAASLAAGNVTILATTMQHDHAWVSCLRKAWSKFLDPDATFLVSSCRDGDFATAIADRITIYSDSRDEFPAILSSSKASFYATSDGLNLAVIQQDVQSLQTVREDIKAMSNSHRLSSDRLHSVFVYARDVDSIRQFLGPDSTTVFDAGAPRSGKMDFSDTLESARQAGLLLLVVVQSLDRALDLMLSLSSPIQQIAFLGPKADQSATFVRSWVTARIYSVDFIYPLALPDNEAATRYGSNGTLFLPSTFSCSSMVAVKTPSGLSPSMSIDAIRASYERMILPLRSEPRGERIGFFTQVEYLIKGVGAAVGAVTLASLFLGARWWLRQRH